jgi:ubiquinone/menaquinone biosynthesis C-methylase UbiE
MQDASVDAVTTRSVLIYVAQKQQVIHEFCRVLKPGGRLSLFEPINRFGEPQALDTLLSMMSVLRLLLLTLRTAARSRAALQLEVLVLRHQLQVLQRTRPRRVRLAKADRWLWVVLARLWTG